MPHIHKNIDLTVAGISLALSAAGFADTPLDLSDLDR